MVANVICEHELKSECFLYHVKFMCVCVCMDVCMLVCMHQMSSLKKHRVSL